MHAGSAASPMNRKRRFASIKEAFRSQLCLGGEPQTRKGRDFFRLRGPVTTGNGLIDVDPERTISDNYRVRLNYRNCLYRPALIALHSCLLHLPSICPNPVQTWRKPRKLLRTN